MDADVSLTVALETAIGLASGAVCRRSVNLGLANLGRRRMKAAGVSRPLALSRFSAEKGGPETTIEMTSC